MQDKCNYYYDKMSRKELEYIYINSNDDDIKNKSKSALCQLALIEEWEPSEFEIYLENLNKKRKRINNNNEDFFSIEDFEKMSLFELENLYIKVTDERIISMIKSEISQKALQSEWEPSELSYYLEELDKEKKVKRKKL